MSDDSLLREYIEELVELHMDPKMKKILGATAGSVSARALQKLHTGTGDIGNKILITWLEKSGIEFDPEMSKYVTAAFPKVVKQYGFQRGPTIMLALLDDRYANKS